MWNGFFSWRMTPESPAKYKQVVHRQIEHSAGLFKIACDNV